MLFKHPTKHLTEKSFYTHRRFFNLFIEKNDLEDKEGYFLHDFELGNNERGDILNKLFMSLEILGVLLMKYMTKNRKNTKRNNIA